MVGKYYFKHKDNKTSDFYCVAPYYLYPKILGEKQFCGGIEKILMYPQRRENLFDRGENLK